MRSAQDVVDGFCSELFNKEVDADCCTVLPDVLPRHYQKGESATEESKVRTGPGGQYPLCESGIEEAPIWRTVPSLGPSQPPD